MLTTYKPRRSSRPQKKGNRRSAEASAGASNTQSVPRFRASFLPGFGFPNQLSMKHKYCEEFTLTAALGVMANYRFRASGLFDPNHTGTGHQPSYFDTMTSLYDHYLVTKSSIEITVVPTTNPATPTAFGLAINDDTSTTPTTFLEYEESSNVDVNYLTYIPGAVRRLKIVYNPARQYIGDPLDNRGLVGGAASDPPEETIFNLFCQAIDQVSNTSLFCVAVVTYEATWFELKDLSVS